MFGANKRAKLVEVVTKKKKTDKKNNQKEALPSIGVAINATQKKVKIDTLSSSKFSSGCAALGVVLNIFEDHVLVSLPGGILGTIQYPEVSDVVHKLVQEGQNKNVRVFAIRDFLNVVLMTFSVIQIRIYQSYMSWSNHIKSFVAVSFQKMKLTKEYH